VYGKQLQSSASKRLLIGVFTVFLFAMVNLQAIVEALTL
jgi:hypothetical protein